ncbi:hypothetical protein [Streptococcus suis]|uniref:Uncharacterized protein n=1 Tax=Streptococcus suis TaxID=1307 RepID=A0A0Z8DJ60_STRSU|nr:hypothetical protein [Streptococcus suis]MBL6515095.1 hypothetical protein [Streptococcus suis]MCK3906202.1 hypothetical protein [Streptococcus suis]MCK3948213.1 hypothetical protein [Streptococcus suis]MCK3963602.1 hypothetical protein [Streptococcus suis]MCK4021702.1 hypothetical protein [Streptococcus suis]
MESTQNLIRIIGILCRIGGGLWALLAYIDFSSAKKNNEGSRQDAAVWGMILGGALAVVGPSMAAALINDLNGITF